MPIEIFPAASDVAQAAADLIANLIKAKPNAVIGLAAGATPEAAYAELIRRHREEGLDFSQVRVFGLDEYIGIDPACPASCVGILRRCLIDHVNLQDGHVTLFDGRKLHDPNAACREHEARIAKAGGLDLQILGLGVNGHIGFNEPGSSLKGRAHALALRDDTLKVNGPIFDRLGMKIPQAAVTIGIGTILEARRVMLLATGAKKAKAVAAALEGPVTAMLPASALQLHPDAHWLLDEAAAADLRLRQDYVAEAAILKEIG